MSGQEHLISKSKRWCWKIDLSIELLSLSPSFQRWPQLRIFSLSLLFSIWYVSRTFIFSFALYKVVTCLFVCFWINFLHTLFFVQSKERIYSLINTLMRTGKPLPLINLLPSPFSVCTSSFLSFHPFHPFLIPDDFYLSILSLPQQITYFLLTHISFLYLNPNWTEHKSEQNSAIVSNKRQTKWKEWLKGYRVVENICRHRHKNWNGKSIDKYKRMFGTLDPSTEMIR